MADKPAYHEQEKRMAEHLSAPVFGDEHLRRHPSQTQYKDPCLDDTLGEIVRP